MAGEMSEHTVGHITNIGCAFAQVFILYRAEGMRVFLSDPVKGVSDIDLFGFDKALYSSSNVESSSTSKWASKIADSAPPCRIALGFESPKPAARFASAFCSSSNSAGNAQNLTDAVRAFAVIVVHHHNPAAYYARRHTDTAKDLFALSCALLTGVLLGLARPEKQISLAVGAGRNVSAKQACAFGTLRACSNHVRSTLH